MAMKIFYDQKWLGFIAPEYIDDMYHVENRLNDKAYAEAKSNALEVGNPTVITLTSKAPIEQSDKVQDWPGDAVIKDGKYILSI